MSEKELVLAAYPEAIALQGFTWMIYDHPRMNNRQIGRGKTEQEAWLDAYFSLNEENTFDG